MRHEHQLLQVLLLRLEGALDRRQLVVEADSFLLEPLDDLLVRLVDALRLVILDHGLVQPVFQCPDVARERRVVVFHLGNLLLEVLELVLHAVDLLLALSEPVLDVIVLAPLHVHVLLERADLRAAGVATLVALPLALQRLPPEQQKATQACQHSPAQGPGCTPRSGRY